MYQNHKSFDCTDARDCDDISIEDLYTELSAQAALVRTWLETPELAPDPFNAIFEALNKLGQEPFV